VAIGAPSALGALFDTASQVLRVLPSIRRSDLPRMACCGPLDSALARSGYHTHPGCDPWEEGP